LIYIGLGSNLASLEFGPPVRILDAVLGKLNNYGVHIVARSRWFRSRPIPDLGQPWFCNGVIAVETGLEPRELLAVLHRIEGDFGRVRRQRWEDRVLDLDLLAYHDRVSAEPVEAGAPILPHPRLAERAFVLLPLAEIAPSWHHPASGQSIASLIARLDPAQIVQPIELSS